MARVLGHGAAKMNVETTRVRWPILAMQALPIVAGVLVIAMRQVQRAGANDWASFVATFGLEFAAALPLLFAHLAAYRLPKGIAALLWIAVFASLPSEIAPSPAFAASAKAFSRASSRWWSASISSKPRAISGALAESIGK